MSASGRLPFSDNPARILIVDDEPVNRQLLEVMLAPEGFLLFTAANGEEALALVARQPPDLILLDVMMPGMDGYSVASRIKGDPNTKNILIVIVTALDDRDARMKGLKAGAEDFLTKPVDRAELSVRVRNLLRLKAYGDFYDKYSQVLEGEVGSQTTKLQETESALRFEQERAKRYIDAAPVILLALDMEGRNALANAHACSVLGWTAAELLGRDWVETCLPSRIRDSLRDKPRDLIGAEVSIVEHPILTRSGEERLIEWSNTALRDDSGQIIGIIKSGTDVTKRHQAVEALRTAEERMRVALQSDIDEIIKAARRAAGLTK